LSIIELFTFVTNDINLYFRTLIRIIYEILSINLSFALRAMR